MYSDSAASGSGHVTSGGVSPKRRSSLKKRNKDFFSSSKPVPNQASKSERTLPKSEKYLQDEAKKRLDTVNSQNWIIEGWQFCYYRMQYRNLPNLEFYNPNKRSYIKDITYKRAITKWASSRFFLNKPVSFWRIQIQALKSFYGDRDDSLEMASMRGWAQDDHLMDWAAFFPKKEWGIPSKEESRNFILEKLPLQRTDIKILQDKVTTFTLDSNQKYDILTGQLIITITNEQVETLLKNQSVSREVDGQSINENTSQAFDQQFDQMDSSQSFEKDVEEENLSEYLDIPQSDEDYEGCLYTRQPTLTQDNLDMLSRAEEINLDALSNKLSNLDWSQRMSRRWYNFREAKRPLYDGSLTDSIDGGNLDINVQQASSRDTLEKSSNHSEDNSASDFSCSFSQHYRTSNLLRFTRERSFINGIWGWEDENEKAYLNSHRFSITKIDGQLPEYSETIRSYTTLQQAYDGLESPNYSAKISVPIRVACQACEEGNCGTTKNGQLYMRLLDKTENKEWCTGDLARSIVLTKMTNGPWSSIQPRLSDVQMQDMICSSLLADSTLMRTINAFNHPIRSKVISSLVFFASFGRAGITSKEMYTLLLNENNLPRSIIETENEEAQRSLLGPDLFFRELLNKFKSKVPEYKWYTIILQAVYYISTIITLPTFTSNWSLGLCAPEHDVLLRSNFLRFPCFDSGKGAVKDLRIRQIRIGSQVQVPLYAFSIFDDESFEKDQTSHLQTTIDQRARWTDILLMKLKKALPAISQPLQASKRQIVILEPQCYGDIIWLDYMHTFFQLGKSVLIRSWNRHEGLSKVAESCLEESYIAPSNIISYVYVKHVLNGESTSLLVYSEALNGGEENPLDFSTIFPV